MTGFGRATARLAAVGVAIEVASVNQRGLAPVIHLPSEWAAAEPEVAARVRSAIQRGKVTRVQPVDHAPHLGSGLGHDPRHAAVAHRGTSRKAQRMVRKNGLSDQLMLRAAFRHLAARHV